MRPFEEVAEDVSPTDVVHGDGAGFDVKASDFGRCFHQNLSDVGVRRAGVVKSDPNVIDDRSISAGRKYWCEISD